MNLAGVPPHNSPAPMTVLLRTTEPAATIVSYRYVVAYFDDRFFVKRVQYRTVLYVHTVADCYGVHVSPQHRIVPDAALVAYRYVPDEDGGFGEETIFSCFGGKAPYFAY